jgi:hypothetical protein
MNTNNNEIEQPGETLRTFTRTVLHYNAILLDYIAKAQDRYADANDLLAVSQAAKDFESILHAWIQYRASHMVAKL